MKPPAAAGGGPKRKGFRAGFRGGDPEEGAGKGGVVGLAGFAGFAGFAGLAGLGLGVPGAGNADWGAPKGDPKPPYPPPPKGGGPPNADAIRSICCRVSGLDLWGG